MDEELRRLRRQAADGDDRAAVEWFGRMRAAPPPWPSGSIAPHHTRFGTVILTAGLAGDGLTEEIKVEDPAHHHNATRRQGPEYVPLVVPVDYFGSAPVVQLEARFSKRANNEWSATQFVIDVGNGLRTPEPGDWDRIVGPLATDVAVWAEGPGHEPRRFARFMAALEMATSAAENLDEAMAEVREREAKLAKFARIAAKAWP